MANPRTHQVILTLTFNKPCTAKFARDAARDCIHGDFFPTSYFNHPGHFKVRGVKTAPRKKKAR
jgi:hypothetical protein